MKPITKPAMRKGVSRSFNHHQAMTAANKGVAALKIAIKPALIDKAA